MIKNKERSLNLQTEKINIGKNSLEKMKKKKKKETVNSVTKDTNIIKDTNINEICKDCLKFERFNKSCWVYWDGKKFCTQKVKDMNDWIEKESIAK